MANKLKKLMKPILKQKCSEAYQEGYKKGMYIGFKQKKLAYESEIDCLKKIQFALHRSVPKWIPVTEKMPPDWISVLIVTPGEHPLPLVHEAYHANNCWATRCVVYNDDEITHWMPLPEPPKEE